MARPNAKTRAKRALAAEHASAILDAEQRARDLKARVSGKGGERVENARLVREVPRIALALKGEGLSICTAPTSYSRAEIAGVAPLPPRTAWPEEVRR